MKPVFNRTRRPFAALGAVAAVSAAMLATPAGAGALDGVREAWAFIKPKLQTPGTINDPRNPVDWTKLKNVPAEIADGADDTGGGASGDITSVGAGQGITGGGDSGDVIVGVGPEVLHGGKAFSEARATADVPSPSGPIATLSVPAGAYFISATLSIEPGPGGTGVNTAHCRLLADSTELNYIIEQVSDSNYFESLALNGVHSFSTGGDVRLSCGAYGSVRAKHISLTAVGLSELTYDPPGQTPG